MTNIRLQTEACAIERCSCWRDMAFGVFLISLWLTKSISDSGTGASPTTVNGARGQSVSLHTGIPAGPDVVDVTWRLLSTSKKIVTYSNKSIDYYGSEEYNRRITFLPGNFSLEIRDLQKEDTGNYELNFTASSGAQTQSIIRLEVFDEIPILEVAVGNVASLTSNILNAADDTEVVWRILSGPTKIAECVNGKFTSFGTEKYKQRIGCHLHDCSLKIRDVRKEDSDVYEVIVTSSSGSWAKTKMLLTVSDWAGTVKGAPGQTVFLPAGIIPWQGVSQVVWRSNKTRIAENASGSISYFGPEEYKRRITLHPGNFSLEIRDLQRKDAGEYEVEVSVGSRAQSKTRVQLEVDESGDRSSHTAWIITGIVIFVILLCCYIFYKKRHDLRLCWNKHMGKKSGTSDEPAVTQSLNSRPGGEQSS